MIGIIYKKVKTLDNYTSFKGDFSIHQKHTKIIYLLKIFIIIEFIKKLKIIYCIHYIVHFRVFCSLQYFFPRDKMFILLDLVQSVLQ